MSTCTNVNVTTASIQNDVVFTATEAFLFISTSYLYFQWQKCKHHHLVARKEFVENMPKVELHVHLDGSFEFSQLLTHLQEESNHDEIFPECITLPWSEPLALRKIVRDSSSDIDKFYNLCTCRGKASLREMIKCFEVFVPIVRGNLDLIEEQAWLFVKKQAAQRVIYTEVRYSPHLLSKGGSFVMPDKCTADPHPVVEAVTKGLIRGQGEFGVKVNQILCCIAWRPDWADDIISIAHDRRSGPCAVVGVDIAAGEEHFDEHNYPHLHKPHFEAFQKAKELDVNVTMHAGEVGNSDFILKAINNYGAKRIGHGYRIIDDPSLMKEALKRHIHFETCPTSSVETGAWEFERCPDSGRKLWDQHPVRKMFDFGLSVSINTDDPSVFDTDLIWQYRIAFSKMGISDDIITQSVLNSIEAAFCDDIEKKFLRKEIKAYVEEFTL